MYEIVLTTETIDLKRRRFLVATTTLIGAAGVIAMAVPLISAMNPTAKAREETRMIRERRHDHRMMK